MPHILAAIDPARGTDPDSSDVSWLLDRAATYLLTRDEPRPGQTPTLFERDGRTKVHERLPCSVADLTGQPYLAVDPTHQG